MSEDGPGDDGWRAVCRIDELAPGEVRAAEVDGRRLAVWRCEDGALGGAVDARCPHQWSDLPQVGDVHRCELVCSTHGWRFDREGTGTKVSVLGRRDHKGDVAAHRCRERDGVIEVQAPSS